MMTPYAIRPSSIHGQGAFATRHFAAGDILPRAIDVLGVGFLGFNHSCQPNLDVSDEYGYVVLRPVKKDEELTVSYGDYQGKVPNRKGMQDCNCQVCRKD
jgi:SET domain-containing protein